MDTGVVVALIAGIGGTLTGLAAILSAILLNRKTMALLEYRMEQVEKSLRDHNGYGGRLETIEKAIIAIQKDIEYIKKEVEEK